MWVCKECNTAIEDSLDACWNCFDDTSLLEEIEKDENAAKKIIAESSPKIETNKYHNLIFFFALLLLTYIIFYIGIPIDSLGFNEFSTNSSNEIAEQIAVIIGTLLVAYSPYWIIKLLIAMIGEIRKGQFIWPNNIMYYFIPIIMWLGVNYLLYFQYY